MGVHFCSDAGTALSAVASSGRSESAAADGRPLKDERPPLIISKTSDSSSGAALQ
jgi:hypothetical protein